MKQLLTLIILMVSINIISAQQIHFTDTSNRWTSQENYYNESLDHWSYSTYTFWLSDTDYSGVHAYTINGFSPPGLIITEDTAAKIVYGTKLSDTGIFNFTLYDFNISIGDTLYIPQIYPTPGELLAHICVVQDDDVLVDGVSHKAYQMQRLEDFYTYNVIEGIGALSGPLGPVLQLSEWGPPSLKCFEHNGERPVFSSVFPNDCYLDIADRSASHSGIDVFPNPSSGTIHIEARQTVNQYRFSIYDIIGRNVYQEQLKDKITLDVSDWQSGLYIIRLTDGKGNTSTRKFNKI